MDYEHESTFSNMYLGTEIRFDGITNLVKSFVAKLANRPATGRKPITA